MTTRQKLCRMSSTLLLTTTGLSLKRSPHSATRFQSASLSIFVGSTRRAMRLALLLTDALFKVVRVKVETVPFCKKTEALEVSDGPLVVRAGRHSMLPHGHYFEAHFKVEPPSFPSIGRGLHHIHFSYDALKPDRKWIATIRNYACGPKMFSSQVSQALTNLKWAGWKCEEDTRNIDIEFAIMDTNPELDDAWLGARL